jgi:hypothetical protein
MGSGELTMDWPAEILASASQSDLDRLRMIERFLTSAERLTDRDWQIIYTRFLAEQRAFDRAVRTFSSASIDSIMHSQRSDSRQQRDAHLQLAELTNNRVAAIASRTHGEAAPPGETASFSIRIRWIMHRVVVILWSIDRVVAVPKRLAAAQQFLTLFHGYIEFPEVAE